MQVLIKNLLGQTIRNTGGNHGGYVRPMAVCEYLYVYHSENRILGTFQELTTNTDHLLFNQDWQVVPSVFSIAQHAKMVQ